MITNLITWTLIYIPETGLWLILEQGMFYDCETKLFDACDFLEVAIQTTGVTLSCLA